MHVQLAPDGTHYLALADDGSELQLARVSSILTEVGLSPRFGRNAQKAANIGTEVHRLIAGNLLRGERPDFNLLEPAVLNSYALFEDYWETAGLVPLDVERCVAHRRLLYGGMLDLKAERWDCALGLVDWKTSEPETFAKSRQAVTLQLAAYAAAEEDAGHPVPTWATAVRIGKTCEQAEPFQVWTDLRGAREAIEAWEHTVMLAFWLREQREAA